MTSELKNLIETAPSPLLGLIVVIPCHDEDGLLHSLLSLKNCDLPNCDAAMAAMTRELKLPDEAPFCIFALGRLTGWLAHAMEQRANGRIIRPRARYTGD